MSEGKSTATPRELLAVVEKAMDEWENDQEASDTVSCAQHIALALAARALAAKPANEAGESEGIASFMMRTHYNRQAEQTRALITGDGKAFIVGNNRFDFYEDALKAARTILSTTGEPKP